MGRAGGGALVFDPAQGCAASSLVGLAVVNHWILDWVTHRADLPLWPEGPRVGLGLWNSIPATLLVEGLLFAAASRFTRSVHRWGSGRAMGILGIDRRDRRNLGERAVVTAAAGARAIAIVGVTMGVFALWGSWIDRHRVPRA